MQFFKSYFIFFKPQKRQKILNVSKLCKSKKSAMVYFFLLKDLSSIPYFVTFFFTQCRKGIRKVHNIFIFQPQKRQKILYILSFTKVKKSNGLLFILLMNLFSILSFVAFAVYSFSHCEKIFKLSILEFLYFLKFV